MTKIPVTVITGFLGSGKTTLLNELLRDPGMADTAVIINEFGEVSIDHLLVETSIENTLVLQSGCICCTVRGDLVDTLIGLQEKRAKGEIPDFSRVLIETTGLADPVPILQTLANDPDIAPAFVLRMVVTTVDAVNGLGQIDEFPEPVKQAALADLILLTKTDLADRARIDALVKRLAGLNPAAKVLKILNGRIAPAALFAEASPDPRASPENLNRWLGAEAFVQHGLKHGEAHAGEGHGHAHHHDLSRHADNIRAFVITHDRPVSAAALKTWLASIASLRGRDLLRMKGVVNVAGLAGPMVVQGVQHLLHPPVALSRWPDADRRTRIVFITRDIPAKALEASFAVLAAGEPVVS